jgi:hypothetical protein
MSVPQITEKTLPVQFSIVAVKHHVCLWLKCEVTSSVDCGCS